MLTRTLAGTCIRVGALTANGQATTMTQATVATDLHKAVDVLANFTMEVAFSGDVCGDIVTEFGQIVLSEIAHADIGVYARFSEDLLRGGRANAIDVGQADFNALIARKVDTNKTCHE